MSELQQQGLYKLCMQDEPERLDGLTTRLLKDNGNISIWKGHSYVGVILSYAGRLGRDMTKTLQSLQILKDKGCDFNVLNKDGFSPLDYIAFRDKYRSVDNPEQLFAAVRFVLMKGGRCFKRREAVIRYMSYHVGMSREQFEAFEQIGAGKTPPSIDEKPDMKKSAVLLQDSQDRQNTRWQIQKADQEIAQLEAALAGKKQYKLEMLEELKRGTADRNLEAWSKRMMRFNVAERKHEHVRE